MAWNVGNQKIEKFQDFNAICKELNGSLDDVTAKLTLTKFLRTNLAWTFRFLSGVELMPIQEVILKGLFLRDNNLIVGGRGFSKCIDINELCITENGMKPIKDVEVGEKIYAYNSFQTILAKNFNPPNEKGYEITTENGFSVRVMSGHKFLVYNPETLENEWKEVDELNTNSILVVKRGMNKWGSRCENNDWCYFLGLLLGDGYLNENYFKITTNDEETLTFLSTFFKHKSFRILTKEGTRAVDFHIRDKELVDYVRSFDLTTGIKAPWKPFPLEILKLSKENIANFLAGLFDTDGYVIFRENHKKNAAYCSINLSSSSLDIIKTTQRVLLNLGISSTIYISHKGGPYEIMGKKCETQIGYCLHIDGIKNIKLFNNQIKLRLTRKREKIDRYINVYQDKFQNDPDTIAGLSEYLKKKYGKHHFRKQDCRLHKNVSYNKLERILSKNLLDPEDTVKLTKILEEKLDYQKIKIRKETLVETVDIQVDKEECYWANGFINHNSFLISVFSILYSIFYPDKKLCLISSNFRSARRILEASEKMVNSKKAQLLKQCFPNAMRRSTDMFRWILPNQSEIFALPLSNGEGLRGTRANCVCVDEGLLISKEIQETILRPFLTVKQDFREEAELRAAEDFLISKGVLKEEDRLSFPKNKFCVFSSASYEFQYLYEMYNSWIDLIYHPEKIDLAPGESKKPTFMVVRASYEALPENGIMDMSQINSAKANGGENTEYFRREYRGLFSKAGDGYFNVKKMFECTIPVNEYPTVQLTGDKNAEYILAIDPSYSASKSSDFFAMGLYMLIPQERKLVLVHSYARAGTDLKEHYEYLSYLFKHFNIVFTVIDNSGSEFIHGFNESTIAKDANLNLKFLDVDFCSDSYLEEISKAKTQYNKTSGKIVYGQNFTSQGIRLMNEHLQNQIDCKKVWFASALGANEKEVKKYENFNLPLKPKNKNDIEMSLSEFIDDQDTWITATINQVALVEVKTTVLGVLQFDLPQNLKRETGPNRPRKDLYTCLLLACWGARNYYEMLFTELSQVSATFDPIFVY